ncbi:MAG: Rrf2 family transcriptional regulator, partial [Lachnospiraceae bacterium]|nr:Rrf2 family transcriptional regulator [Lachnospiraceae bacterium]
KGRYALRVMIDLAEHNDGSYIPLKDIASRQDISKKYLEIIVKDMVSGGLIAGVSGKGGGYRLCRDAEEYTVGEIIELMEGTLAPVACLAPGFEGCPREPECQTIQLWSDFYNLTRDFLYGKKLTDLTGAPVDYNYVI